MRSSVTFSFSILQIFNRTYRELFKTLNRTPKALKKFFRTLKLQGRYREKIFYGFWEFCWVLNSRRGILSKILMRKLRKTDIFEVSIIFGYHSWEFNSDFFLLFRAKLFLKCIENSRELVKRNRICYSELFGLDVHFIIFFIFFSLNQKSFIYIGNSSTH